MMDQAYYLEENKMLRELAQHWEKMYNIANDERVKILRKYDEAVDVIQRLELDYENIKRNLMFDSIFWTFRWAIYEYKDSKNLDAKDLVYSFSQWIQDDGRKILRAMLGSDEAAGRAINKIIEGCVKWGEEYNE